MEKYVFNPIQKKKLPEVQNQRDSSSAGILNIAAHMGNQGMLSVSERLALEEKQPGSSPSGTSSLDKQMLEKFERHFGVPMDDVRIHRNSQEPDEFNADAFTYGSDVYLGPGQEKLLSHEITHTAQQKMGIVPSQGIENGFPVNNSPVLEQEADVESVHGLRPGGTPTPVIQKSPKGKRESTYPKRTYGSQRKDQARLKGPKKVPKGNRVSKYFIGTHGFKRREQLRLLKLFGQAVTGRTHQSEHSIGFAVLNNSGRKREQMNGFANSLPAYQETLDAHQAHVGTGYNVRGRFGFENDHEYRDAQYAAITDDTSGHGVGNAVQLNQLGYSHFYQHSGQPLDTKQIYQADNSFFQMAIGMINHPVKFFKKDHKDHKECSATVSPEEVAEMILARLTMQGKSFPSVVVENKVREICGLPLIDYDGPDQSTQPDQQRMMKHLDMMLEEK